MDTTGITDEQMTLAARGAINALQAAGVDAKVFDMVMGIEYQTRNQWTSGRRPPKRDYVYWAMRQFERVVRLLAETNDFEVDPEMEKYQRRRRHATIIRQYLDEAS